MNKIIKTTLLLLSTFIVCSADITTGEQKSISDEFSQQDLAWSTKKGEWIFKDGVLTQSSTKEDFPLILFEKEKFSTVDISVDFKAISGRIDASGGIVFRAVDKDNYFIVRANALEGNYRLYTFKNGIRNQIATATIETPQIKQFHRLRVVAKGKKIKAYLNGKLLIEHEDDSFSRGYVGLWTKADSVTKFDNFKVVGE